MADWAKDAPSPVLAISRAKGIYLYDTDGKRYIDGVSSLWCNLLGHRHPAITKAIKTQLDKVAHTTFLGLTHEPAAVLSQMLIAIAPKGFSRVYYSDNGSTAVEIALKMAYQYWLQTGHKGKTTFLALRNAYHGDTIGASAVGGIDIYHAKFGPLFFKTHFAQSPYCLRCKHQGNCKHQCLQDVERILQTNGRNIAAAIIEPLMQAAGGMIKMPTGYLKAFAALCRKYGILLIADEVATGFGRTGTLFACQQEGVKPDFMCLSKGITGGYLPLAVTLTDEKIYQGFLGCYEEFKTFFHGHTYTANPLACAAAIATINILKKDRIIESLPAKVEHLGKQLTSLKDLPNVVDVRQVGLMAGIELAKDRITLKDFPAKERIGARICAACRPKGLIIRPLGNTLVLMPPITITNPEISRMVNIVKKSILEILS